MLIKILTAAFTGTSAMTLFSYWVSEQKRRQFKEPKILALLIKRLPIPMNKHCAYASGWLIHYGVGSLFSLVYDIIWRKTKINPTLTNGLFLGTMSGILGAGVWKLTLDIHPNPPNINRKNFYPHIVLAHAIFGIFVVAGYNLAEHSKQKIARRSKIVSST